MSKNIIIIGGGIAGLLSAFILSKKENTNIHVVEKKNILGGLYGYFDYGEYGRFDYGAHNILETGIDELDTILTSLLPKDEWNITSAVNEQKRTTAGLFYKGKLQKNIPFLDLRDSNKNQKNQYLEDLLKANATPYSFQDPNLISAYEFAESMFGTSITEGAICEVLNNVFGMDAKDLNSMCLLLMGMKRVCLLENEELDKESSNPIITNRLCYPDQREVPKQFLRSLKAYYPKKFGMYRIVDALVEKLHKAGNVTIHKNSIITNIETSKQHIDSVTINDTIYNDIDKVISSANLSSLANLLQIDYSDLEYDPNPKTVITNILIDKPLIVGDLSYFGCYDKGYNIYRVDNYYNYCGEGALRLGFYPVSIEMIVADDNIDNEQLEKRTIEELKSFGVMEQDTQIKFAATEILEYGFPLLSQKNVRSFDILRERIESLEIDNLIKIGILSEKDLFFEGEIKQDLFKKLKDL